MIEVRMRQDDRVDVVSRDRKRLSVPLAKFLESLKQPCINQHFRRTGVEQVLGAGDGPRGAEKSN